MRRPEGAARGEAATTLGDPRSLRRASAFASFRWSGPRTTREPAHRRRAAATGSGRQQEKHARHDHGEQHGRDRQRCGTPWRTAPAGGRQRRVRRICGTAVDSRRFLRAAVQSDHCRVNYGAACFLVGAERRRARIETADLVAGKPVVDVGLQLRRRRATPPSRIRNASSSGDLRLASGGETASGKPPVAAGVPLDPADAAGLRGRSGSSMTWPPLKAASAGGAALAV